MGASCILETLKAMVFTLAFWLSKLFSLLRLPSTFSADKRGPSTENRSLAQHGLIKGLPSEISAEHGGLSGVDGGIQRCAEDVCCISDDRGEISEDGPSAEDGGCTKHGGRYVVAEHGGKGISPADGARREHGSTHVVVADDGEFSSKRGIVVCRNSASAERVRAVSADEDLSVVHGGAFSEDGSGHGNLSFAEDDGAQDEDPRKQEFLFLYKEQYGYPKSTTSVDKIRSNEFPQLKGEIYLDHAGATLYSSLQMHSNLEDLCKNLYGNPHSQSGCSNISANMVANAREEVLKFFNVTRAEYKCVFTAGATAALKLVGEYFPWTTKSSFWYTMENHNSVLGIREYALAAGASAYAVEVEGFGQQQNFKLRARQWRTISSPQKLEEGLAFNLFAFPSECNFSGRKFNLDLVKSMQDKVHTKDSTWMVLIDAAKGCATSRLDLSKYPADFVAISFYKIFGYPTGLGALLLRNESSKILQKKYFGGGTVAVSTADVDFVQRREDVEQWLEDGTVPFLGISALHRGFSTINKLGISKIGMHVGSLAKFTASQLSGLKHKNGNNVCVLYGNHDFVHYWGHNCNQGPIITFNLKRGDGTWIGYREVEELASLNGIHLRTGCFCNPGACSKYLDLTESEIRANHEAGHVCWDDHDVIDGKPTGAVRVSFGYMSSIEDSLALLDFICKYFLENPDPCPSSSLKQPTLRELANLASNDNYKVDCSMYLESITVYPIKSCGGFTVDSWPLGDCGLLYDREWVVMSSAGFALTQKKCPMMCLIGTYIEPSRKKLLVTSPNMQTTLEIPLIPTSHQTAVVSFDLCGERSIGKLYEEEVANWFTEALGTACTLAKKQPRSRQVRLRGGKCNSQACKDAKELSYANEGQFLLVSRASVDDLNWRAISSLQRAQSKHKKKAHHSSLQVDVMRFRPNFVVSGGSAFEEDSWQSLDIGGEKFIVLGGCNRCQMINIDQATGRSQEGSNPLLTLASYRRSKGKILFGLLLAHSSSLQQQKLEQMGGPGAKIQPQRIIKVASRVHVERDVTALLTCTGVHSTGL